MAGGGGASPDEDEESETDVDGADGVYDEQDEGQTDNDASDTDTDEEEDEEVQPGDVVWGLLGRIWYPGKVCNLSDLPEKLQAKFNNIMGKFIVLWYSDRMYSAVTRVERLGETQLDAKRASRSHDMQKFYNMALSDL